MERLLQVSAMMNMFGGPRPRGSYGGLNDGICRNWQNTGTIIYPFVHPQARREPLSSSGAM